MTDFNTAVQEAMVRMTESGELEKAIEKQLHETIQDIVKDQLRSYSKFGKEIKEKIEKELRIDLDNVNFSEYNKVVLNLIEGQLNNAVTGEAEQKLKEDMAAMFESPPSEIKLSDLIEKYKEENNEEFDRDGASRISLILGEKDGKYVSIGLHPKDTKGYRNESIDSWQDCNLYLSVRLNDDDESRGKLRWTNDRDGLNPHQFMPTCLHGTSRLLYQMYCAGSELIFDQGLDQYDYDLSYGDDY